MVAHRPNRAQGSRTAEGRRREPARSVIDAEHGSGNSAPSKLIQAAPKKTFSDPSQLS
jgi:hypothetical protein